MADTKKKIVIIGNGYGGSKFTAALAKLGTFDITVVTPLRYHEVPLMMTKVVAVGPAEHEKALKEFVQEDGVSYKFATCTSLTDDTATLSDGSTLTFDAAVVCTGLKLPFFYPDPETDTTVEARKATIAAFHEKIVNAKSIVISGGGPVGVETVADIILRFPTKKITLVHSHNVILDSMSKPFPELAMSFLKKQGVSLVLSDRVISYTGTTNPARQSRLKCTFREALSEVNTGFMPPASLDSKGFIKVDKKFKVEGLSRVFAFANCANVNKLKTIPQLEDQLPTVLHNLCKALAVPPKPLADYQPGFGGTMTGPPLVVLGHGIEDGIGLGPDLPGYFLPFCLWLCCCCGPPCSTPVGKFSAKFKSDFNLSITVKKGEGMTR